METSVYCGRNHQDLGWSEIGNTRRWIGIDLEIGDLVRLASEGMFHGKPEDWHLKREASR
ncbi:hypothetical protein RvY_15738 [Ramazzottius varieornatus]|uniref:Uncharacterized protein n=1 Tax=Ramazzottius varieornatus TaxID=947166 RepID=A0A1D1W0J5_RAMVA|nr:hypothetical protein RvY_15738 [Ramazzottius varieornatus]